MVWRIHFTAADLARTKVAGSLGPLAETVFGLSLLLRRPCRTDVLDGWRARSRRRLTKQMGPLAALVPMDSRGLDLVTLTGEAATIEQGVDALRAMRPEHVRAELEYGVQHGQLPAFVWDLVDRDGAGRRQLAEAAVVSYRRLVEPHWTRVGVYLAAERVARGRVLLDGGVDRLLATLHPAWMRWRLPVLEVHARTEMDLHLDGRGLTLVPSVFVGNVPVLLWDLCDATAAPRLVYPAAADPVACGHLWMDTRLGERALGALLGDTRAAALRRIADGCTTSELARHLSISAAAASQHATVLRDAGLITTSRRGCAVWHSLTSLGIELLDRGEL